jgi:hypothetical protein
MAGSKRFNDIWLELDCMERELKLEQKYLGDIWLKICEKHKENEKDRVELDSKKLIAGLEFVDPETTVRLNVGGQLFETKAGVLCQDEYSVLAGLCRGAGSSFDSRLARDCEGPSAGTFFIDRDWWIFRHIMQFLRTGSLPDDSSLVDELYEEASFYRLSILRSAIESGVDTSLSLGTADELLKYRHCSCRGFETAECKKCVTQRTSMRAEQLKPQSGQGLVELPDPFGFSVSHGRATTREAPERNRTRLN